MPAPDGSSLPPNPSPSASGTDLLGELESARDLMARRLVNDHPQIDDTLLNSAIVSCLLQVLFLRAGEEYGIVPSGTVATLAGCDGIAGRMARACADAGPDPAVLFDPGPGPVRALPAIPDDPLRAFLVRAEAPGFPVPPVRLSLAECASVLDKFLGIRVQVAEGYRVKRDGKSALLYTGSVDIPPQDLVDAAVRETLMAVTRTASGADSRDCRVLDMACGAGVFLLSSYRFLSRSHGRGAMGSVFGTDIDPESVSAARFVLLLGFIEEIRHAESAPPSPGRIRDAVTTLSRTIRCGNALIGPDYFANKPVFPFNAEERRRVNPFSWEEAFPEILAAGGFDAVTGAPPPYRPFAVQAREEYFQMHYAAYAPSAGLYGYFIGRGLSLLRPGGALGVLVPGTFLRSDPARPLRRLILTRRIAAISGTGHTRVLADGPVPVYFLRLANEPPAGTFPVAMAMDRTAPARDTAGVHRFTLDQSLLDDGGWRLEDTREADLLARVMASGTPLGQYVLGEIRAGTYRSAYNPRVVDRTVRDSLTKRSWWCRRFFVPLLCPADLRRWLPGRPEHFVIEAGDPRHLRKCGALAEYLKSAAGVFGITAGAENEGADLQAGTGDPGEIPAPDPAGAGPAILFARHQPRPVFCYAARRIPAMTDSLMAIDRNDLFLLAILNSALGRFVLERTCPLTDAGYDLGPGQIGKFPVLIPDFDRLADRTRHTRLTGLVTQILELNRYLAQARTDQERRFVLQEIDATEVRIDALVYEWYGLTREEIAVAEGKSG